MSLAKTVIFANDRLLPNLNFTVNGSYKTIVKDFKNLG